MQKRDTQVNVPLGKLPGGTYIRHVVLPDIMFIDLLTTAPQTHAHPKNPLLVSHYNDNCSVQ